MHHRKIKLASIDSSLESPSTGRECAITANSVSSLPMSQHEAFMRRALELALLGGRAVAPNPLVGAVVVHEGNIIGEGYHQRFGGPHAEVHAIASVQDRSLLSNSNLYVTLEPCSHHGKTPPCAELVVSSGIKSVVVGCRDPFPQVSGRGIARLREAGITVQEGVMQGECSFANRRFITRHTEVRPYTILKWAESSDGFIAPEDRSRRQLSGAEAQALSHSWRTEEMGILVGRVTALTDDPQLTARLVPGANPTRFVLDRSLQLPPTLRLFDGTAPTVVLNSRSEGSEGSVKRVLVPDESFSARAWCQAIAQLGVNSLIVEGGARTLQSFIDQGLWDEARIFKCSTALGTGVPAPRVAGIPCLEGAIGHDTLRVLLHESVPQRFGVNADLALHSLCAMQQSSWQNAS